MGQVFHPRANTIWKLIALAAGVTLVSAAIIAETMKRSSYITEEGVAISQPVPFSHKHHVASLGLDCRYCHTSVETSSYAGMPPTHTCMTCHSQVWDHAPMLEPVRRSYRLNEPLHWNRVTRLPHYVYFDHSVHVRHGVACVTCHGRVDEMPLTWRYRSFYMDDCLSCHKNPGPQLRPLNQVFNMDWKAPSDPFARSKLAQELLREYHVPDSRRLTDCYVCHR